MPNLIAARAARADAALDKLYREPGTLDTYTHRGRLEAGFYAYRVAILYTDGKRRYGLISADDAAEAVDGEGRFLAGYPGLEGSARALALHFTAYYECPKLVYDAADLPALNVEPGSVAVEADAAELAHLLGSDPADHYRHARH